MDIKKIIDKELKKVLEQRNKIREDFIKAYLTTFPDEELTKDIFRRIRLIEHRHLDKISWYFEILPGKSLDEQLEMDF